MKPYPSITVAIAEDCSMFRETLVNFITEYNPAIRFLIQVADGKQLIEQLELARPLPDIVLLDIGMPVMNGYDTMRIIKQRWPNLKVLVFSVFESEFSVVNMLRLGALGFVHKGCSSIELSDALLKIYSEGFYYSNVTVTYLTKEFSKIINKTPYLSDREMEFLYYTASEMAYKEIASKMEISERAVEYYRQRLFQKLNIKSRIGLVLFAFQTGLVSSRGMTHKTYFKGNSNPLSFNMDSQQEAI